MELSKLVEKLPLIRKWIEVTLNHYASKAKPIDEFNFKNLPLYYSDQLLRSAKVVVVDQVPVPPLTSFGLAEFSGFEKGDYAGITFKDTYFVNSKEVFSESLHFHELIHIVQWKHLGVEKFLIAYALGLLKYDYQNSPFEVMAYKHQANFDSKAVPYNVEKVVLTELNALLPSILDKAFKGEL